MTDRLYSLVVALDADMRDDDAAQLIAAIGCLRGVASVAGMVADPATWMAELRARIALRNAVLAVFEERKIP